MRKIIAIITILILTSAALFGAESLYPSDFGLSAGYVLSSSEISAADTLIITRTITNNESFTLSGLYFTDNLPSQFSIASYIIRLNGVDVTAQYSSHLSPSIISGYNYCEWLIDNPGGNPANNIYSGQTLTFTLRVICQTPGQYNLPFHTASFYGNNSGFFSTDDAITVTVNEAPDTIPPAAIGDLEAISGQ